jgi:tetratricopeptide (TPR) repeat protein
MTVVLLLASAAMAAVAAAGILHPFGRGRGPAIEPLADPLEDERDLLLTTLRELEGEHAEGALGNEEYRSLRHETERQAVAVLRALGARDGAGTDSLAGLRSSASPNGHLSANGPGRKRVGRVVVLAGLAVTAGVAVLLVAAVGPRDAAQPISGDGSAIGLGTSSLSFFQERVRLHPEDVAARLDLAQRYRDAGLTGLAALQYTEAIRLDPANGEARTGMASVLFTQGHTREALREARRALAVDPSYPEALYQEGVILLRGLQRPAEAAAPLQAYLSAAPTGGHRAAVEAMLEEIGALAAATPSP